jgi:histidine triad (HIT) family protein
MPENCVFCQIIARQVPAEIVYQDDLATAFMDLHPAAPVHLLIVPNIHITSLNQITEEDANLLGYLLVIGRKLAEQYQVSQSGYRLLINTGADAGQTVFHLHLHLLGGQRLSGLSH